MIKKLILHDEVQDLEDELVGINTRLDNYNADIDNKNNDIEELKDNNEDFKNLNDEVAEILAKQKKVWKKEKEYEVFIDSLTDEERASLSPDEIKLKLSQIHTWRENEQLLEEEVADNDRYKNNV